MTVIENRKPEHAAAGSPAAAARTALDSAVQLLRSRQHEAGWWKGALDTNVTMDAEDLLLRKFLGMSTPEVTEPAAQWIRSQQRADGTWATFHSGPGDLSTTIEAWVALRLAGDLPDEPHMRRAAEFARNAGGVEASRGLTRIWLYFCGFRLWDACPELPPEIMFLPPSAPLNIYNWGCWARQTIVPLTIVCTLKPVRPLAFGIDELRTWRLPPRPASPWQAARLFHRLPAALRRHRRR